MIAARRSSRKFGTRSLRNGVARFLMVGLFVVFVLVPLYWVIITSIKPSKDYLTVPPVWFPADPTLVHYTAALFSYRGLQGLINSLIISSAATLLSAAMGTMMAYSLARFRTGGQHLAFWVLSQRFLPPVAIVLPIFLLFRGWGLYDTHIGLILAYTFMTLPLSVWMMYAYFRQLPKSLEDAALVDGLSRWQAFRMVAVPLAAPGRRRGCGVRLHRGMDRVLLRADPDQPLRLYPADDLPRLPGLPGRAVRRSLRARDHISRSVDRARHAGAAPSGARPHARRAARMTER